LHFFSPAHVMRLVEVVRSDKTSVQIVATAMKLSKQLGKIGVQVGVCHGFVGNRMLEVRQREAVRLTLEGTTPWEVDRVMLEFGFPMGPFAMSDLVGLDVGWSNATSCGETVRDILCEMGRRGQKTGAGFYDYSGTRQATPSAVTESVIRLIAERFGIAQRAAPPEEILGRCLYPLINEGIKLLEEGKALRAGDIDMIWVTGYGWPVPKGGPMFFGDQFGPANLLRELQSLRAKFGDDFAPALSLEQLASSGHSIQDLRSIN
jgi:3-hydroxyacyl-CoA dehydrogenase